MRLTIFTIIFTSLLTITGFADEVTTLDSLLIEALEKNPEIRASKARWEASTKRPSQEGSLPDPMIGISWQNVGFDQITLNEDPDSMLMFPFTQEFPFPGKLSLKEGVAKQEADAQEQYYKAIIRRVIADLREAYYDWYAVTKSIEITKTNKELTQKFVKIAEARYEVGMGIQQDVIRSQVEVSKFIEQFEILEQQKGVLESKILSILNRPPENKLGIPQNLERTPLAYSAKELYKLTEDNAPLLKVKANMIEREEESLKLAKREYYPDFVIGVSPGIMGRDEGGIQGVWEVELGVRVPLYFWRKQRYGVEEAALELKAAREEFSSEKQDLLFMINENYLAANTSGNLLTLYKDGIIPQSTLSLESAISGYQVGDVDFLTLLDNLITLFNFEIEYHRQLSQYLKSLARLEEITGVELMK